MKSQVLKLLILIACVTGYQNSFGQCTGGSNAGSLTPTINWQTLAGVDGMDYYTFAAVSGNIYYFSFCAADGGSSTRNTEITINTNGGVAVAGAYNDDFCGSQSYLAWTCGASATYRVLLSRKTCNNQNNMGTLAYRFSLPNTCPAGLGTGVTNVASLPYASGASTTCGGVNDINSLRLTTSCGTNSYYDGEDKVWIFTPAVSGQVTVTLANTASNVILSVFDACPVTGSPNCMGSSQGNNTRTVAFCATAGQAYYVLADCQLSTACFAYSNLTISAPNTVWCNYTCPAGLGSGVTNVASLPYTNGAGTTCGGVNDFDSTRIVTCGTGTYYAGEDKVWIFTPATTGQVTINLTTAASNVSLSAYLGCPLNGNGATCLGSSQGNNNRSLAFCATAGQTYYVIADAQIATGCFAFTNLTISAPNVVWCDFTCPSGLGTGVANVASLPYANGAGTTCGGVNDFDSTRIVTCGTGTYYAGEDKVWIFTPATTGQVTINLNATANNISLSAYLGCPLNGNGATCLGSSQGNNNRSLTFCVLAGQTYYVIADAQIGTGCFAFTNLTISAVSYAVVCDYTCPGGLGTGVTNVVSLPYANGAGTTCGAVNDFDATRITTCGTATYYAGEDKVWVFTPSTSGRVTIALTSAASNINVSAYLNCPLNGNGATCMGSSQGNGNRSLQFCVIAGQTYYVVADAQIATGCFAFTNLTISAPQASFCTTTCPAGLGTGVTNVASLPYANGVGTTCGAINDFDNTTITACGTGSYYGGEDKVWIFTPASNGTVTITLNTLASNVNLSLYDNCPLNGNGATCIDYSQGNGDRTITFCVTSGLTYYVIADAQIATGCFAFTDLSITAPSSLCNMGTGVTSITLPFSSSGRTTCGKVDDVNSGNVTVCGDNSFMDSEDEVFTFTATGTGTSIIKMNTAGVNSAIFVYDGCPMLASCSGASCVATKTGTGDKTMCVSLISGHTYYVVVDSKTTCFNYGISITFPVVNLPGATCGSPYVLAALPSLINAESTECYGDDYTSASIGSCGTSYESGEDKVYRYVATGPICLSISLSGASTNNIGCQVYSGCPGSVGTTCVKSFGGATSGVLSGSVSLPSAGTYYIIVDTWSTPSFVQYNLKIEANGSVDNDLPCNAQPMALGFFYSGSNHCSSGGGDPTAPACWVTPNTINSVWYSFVAPSSGNVVIRTALGTLKNPQIAVYTGTCGSGLTYVNCNDNAPSCGTTATKNSQLALTGLTPGTIYYIVVDGYGVVTGTFSLIVQDGTIANLPNFAGQECDYPINICNGTTSVGDPGFQDFGNKCDFPGGGTNCLTTAERGSAWYQVTIASAGSLEFDIVPNDWLGAPSTTSTDYDFAVWKTTGTGATNCGLIATGATPTRCNYSALGVTGCYSTGNSPTDYPGYNGSYESAVTVAAGDVFLIHISNFSNSTSGFTMYFPPSAPVDYSAGATQAFWTGSVDNDWFKSENWGGCTVPNCTVDAAILAAPANQPYISQSGSACKSLNVHPGAVLTINATRTLSICGNVLNNGNILGNLTSTLYFGNAAVPQTMNGNFIYPNTIGNLTVNKSGGSLSLQQNLNMSGNLLIQTSNSVLNAYNKTINLEGNLSNNTGQFNMDTTGVLNLIGTGIQTYLNHDTLTNVTINNSGGGIDMSSYMLLNNKGILTLTNGKVVTNSNEVSLLNSANNAVGTGSSASYIEGNLRRAVPAVSAARQYDFPVGNLISGYQRMNMNFYGGITPAIGSLAVNFSSFPGNPPTSGNDVECWVTYQDTMLNNGYWTLTSQGSGNADANITLYNLNYSNAKTQYCVAQSTNGTTYAIPALNSGLCTTPPVTAVLRNAVANALTASVPKYLGTAQGYPSPLPVELVSLIAKAQKKSILVNWITASEKNNAGFYLQRSTNGFEFTDIQWIPGAGTVNTEQFYSYDDKDVIGGIEYYYRLNQVDYDGKSTISNVVHAALDAKNGISLTASPNPYKGSTNINYKLPSEGQVKIIITDVAGRIIKQINNGLQNAGSYSIPFSATKENLRGGMYYVTLYFNDTPYRTQITELN